MHAVLTVGALGPAGFERGGSDEKAVVDFWGFLENINLTC